MFVIGGWNGHDTMDDIYQYSFPTKLWFEIRRLKGVRPRPRYRHCAVALKKKILKNLDEERKNTGMLL